MGSEAIGYVQFKNINNGEWELLPLYDEQGRFVNLWGCSDFCNALGDNILLSREEAKIINDLTEGYEPDDDYIQDWYSISLPLLKVRGRKNKLLKELSRNVEAAARLANIYYRSLDDIRYVYYISY